MRYFPCAVSRVFSCVAASRVVGVLLAVGLGGCIAASAQIHHAAASHAAAASQPVAHLEVDTGTIAKPASKGLYGLMTEEINHAYEGGLYAELVNNGTFRGNWMGVDSWTEVARGNAAVTASIDREEGPSSALHNSLELKIDGGVGRE